MTRTFSVSLGSSLTGKQAIDQSCRFKARVKRAKEVGGELWQTLAERWKGGVR